MQAHVRAAFGHTEVANPDQHVAIGCILGGVSIRPALASLAYQFAALGVVEI